MFNLRHRISFRLYLAIGLAVGLTFAASLVGWFSFDRLGIAQSKVNEESIPEIAAAFAVAQHVGDLVTATDRLSVAATLDDLDNIRGFIAEISPALQENVSFLSELEGERVGEADRLERIRTNSGALISNVSRFDSNILEHYEMTRAGDDLRLRLENARLVWDRLAVGAMAAEVAYWSQVSPESGRGDLQGFLHFQEAIDDVVGPLALAAIAVDPMDITQLARDAHSAGFPTLGWTGTWSRAGRGLLSPAARPGAEIAVGRGRAPTSRTLPSPHAVFPIRPGSVPAWQL